MRRIIDSKVRTAAFLSSVTLGLLLPATSDAGVFRTRFDPVFNTTFDAANSLPSGTVGWRGTAQITVADGCLVPSTTQTVGVGPCTSASLDSASLVFYDFPAPGQPAYGPPINWLAPLLAPSSLSIDASGEVNGMDFAAVPLTAVTTLWNFPEGYNVALDFTFAGPTLTLTWNPPDNYDGTVPDPYVSGLCGTACNVKVEWDPVPEPTALALTGLALAALGIVRRRKA